jgi:hypothetical protein
MTKAWSSVLLMGISFSAGMVVMQSQQPVAQTRRFPQFENASVKVWRSLVMPNSPMTMHRHEHGRVIIPLQGGTMRMVEQNGPTETHVWEVGNAYWLPAMSPGTLHADVNGGTKPIEVMVVEVESDK